MAGSIQKTTGPHGVAYLVRVEFPRDPITGKRKQRSESFSTKKAAEIRLAEWLTEIERGTAIDLRGFKVVSLLLRNPDFNTAKAVADAVNESFHKEVAAALDNTRIDVSVADAAASSVPDLISRVQTLTLEVQTPAKIVVNERTGTIVLGGDVKLTPVSVIHGSLSIQVVTSFDVAAVPSEIRVTEGRDRGRGGDRLQPVIVPQTNLTVNDGPAQTMRLDDGANVEELVNGLHAIGTTAHDVVAILQAIKAEGGLQAELEVQ
jgi:flagellar P-ring protein precursor FlgI